MIGEGATSKVYKILWQDKLAAVKIMKEDKNGICKEAICEMGILKLLKHEYIIELYDVILDKDTSLILEYAELTLKDVEYNLDYMWQLCVAVNYCHQHQIIHCDIKPQNILIKNNQVKLADFGLAQFNYYHKSRNVVSLWYRAPEIMKNQNFDYLIDVWAIGCVWYEFLYKQVLYKGECEQHQLRLIKYKNINNLLLMIDPKERITSYNLVKLFKTTTDFFGGFC